jgi:glyoxylase-like metal-dependent hydrolase (beta-lactamase superfamily II)
MASAPEEIAPDLWRWTARHPQWHPGEFGREVACFAMRVRAGGTLLVDPLLPPDEPDAVLALLDALASGRGPLNVYITIPYHVRSTREIVGRYGGERVRVWGERRAARRLAPDVEVIEPEPGAELPFGGRAFSIGRPRRSELPLWIEDHAALAFGDAVVTTPEGALRVWSFDRLDARRLAFYRDRFVPTLAPLLELPARRILVTHGDPVLEDGAAALRRAAAEQPWYHHG